MVGKRLFSPLRSARKDPAKNVQLFSPRPAGSSCPVRANLSAATPTHVWDGDGPVWCAEGPRLRLIWDSRPELDGSCSPGHPCPDSDPIVSRDALVNLLGTKTGVGPHGHILVSGPRMRCTSTGSAGGDRTGAWCVSPRSGDISCAMVRGGWAARWERFWQDHRCP